MKYPKSNMPKWLQDKPEADNWDYLALTAFISAVNRAAAVRFRDKYHAAKPKTTA